MTTVTLSGTYKSGYTLSAPVQTLSITSSGYVKGSGVSTSATATGMYEVVNDGRVIGKPKLKAYGVYLAAGGEVTNGNTGDTIAQISGAGGIKFKHGPGTVLNFGTVAALGHLYGAYFGAGGTLVNGSDSDPAALIAGEVKISAAPGTVTNYGVITGVSLALDLEFGGLVTNGGAGDVTARIENEILAVNGPATIANFGLVGGTSAAAGIVLGSGGSVVNGSNSGMSASIEGLEGVLIYGSNTTLQNFGTIHGFSQQKGVNYGLSMQGGVITNGSQSDPMAVIEGGIALRAEGDAPATVVNYGTIKALPRGTQQAIAVDFRSSADTLVVEGGCRIIGLVEAHGGTIDLASGSGTITQFQDRYFVVSGSISPASFHNVGTVAVGSGATFVDAGYVGVYGSQNVQVRGVLTLGGAGTNSVVNSGDVEADIAGTVTFVGMLTNSGTISSNGGTLRAESSVVGTGIATINGGALEFASSFGQNVKFESAGGELSLARSQGYTGTISGFSKSGATTLDLGDVEFVSSSQAVFSGTTSGGILTVSDGVHTARIRLAGDYLQTSFVASSDGTGGVDIVTSRHGSASLTHQFIEAAAAFGARVSEGSSLAPERIDFRQPMLAAPRGAAAY